MAAWVGGKRHVGLAGLLFDDDETLVPLDDARKPQLLVSGQYCEVNGA